MQTRAQGLQVCNVCVLVCVVGEEKVRAQFVVMCFTEQQESLLVHW